MGTGRHRQDQEKDAGGGGTESEQDPLPHSGRNLMDPFGMDHDSGFKWLPTAVADYRVTGGQAWAQLYGFILSYLHTKKGKTYILLRGWRIMYCQRSRKTG